MPVARPRSHHLSIWLNGDLAEDTRRTLPETSRRSPAAVFAFIDKHERSCVDATFDPDRPGGGLGNTDCWIGLPADCHCQDANLAFVDDEVERWRWQAPKRFAEWGLPNGVCRRVRTVTWPTYGASSEAAGNAKRRLHCEPVILAGRAPRRKVPQIG